MPNESSRFLHLVRDVLNLGLAHARIALGHFLGVPIHLVVQDIRWMTRPDDLGFSSSGAGIACRIRGPLSATWAFFIDDNGQEKLTSILLHRYFHDRADVADLQASSFQEFGNIFISSFLSGLANVYPGRYLPTVPRVVHDPRELFPNGAEPRDRLYGPVLDIRLFLFDHPYPARMGLITQETEFTRYLSELHRRNFGE